jgi:hypothetical protein
VDKRASWKEQLAQSRVDADGHPELYGSYLKSVRTNQQMRQEAYQIKKMRGKLRDSQPLTCTYTDPEDPEGVIEIQCKDKKSYEAAIINEITQRFSLAHGSPPYQDPLLSAIGLLGDTETASSILQGTYTCPRDMDPYLKDVLTNLAMPQRV